MTLYNEPNKFPSPKGNARYYVEHVTLRKSFTNEHSPSSQEDDDLLNHGTPRPLLDPKVF